MLKIFKKITVVAHHSTEEVKDTLNTLLEFLQTQQLDIHCETHAVEYTHLGENADLVIVVGGDGSMLRAAKCAAKYNTPVLGINHGRLGFLTDIRPQEITTRLAAILAGEYWIGERFFLHAETNFNNQQNHCGLALNDVVLSPGRTPHMLEFEIYVDDKFLCSHRADGLIVATPTGSTAYALSGGGPIIQPDVDALVMLPMFSHTLTSRPIVVPGDSIVRIEFSADNETDSQLSCDGGDIVSMPPGGHVQIAKNSQTVQLIHPLDYNYYAALRSKLDWGKKLTPSGEKS